MADTPRAKLSGKEIIIWVAILGIAAFMIYGSFGKKGGELVGEPAPAFALAKTEGDKVSLASLQGRVVVLNIFATWCPPCKREIPDFAKFQDSIAKDDSVAMFGVVYESGAPAKAEAKSQALGVNYPILHGNDALASQYHLHTYPTTVIIDGDGMIRHQIEGTLSYEQLEKLVEQAKKPLESGDAKPVAQRSLAASTSAM